MRTVLAALVLFATCVEVAAQGKIPADILIKGVSSASKTPAAKAGAGAAVSAAQKTAGAGGLAPTIGGQAGVAVSRQTSDQAGQEDKRKAEQLAQARRATEAAAHRARVAANVSKIDTPRTVVVPPRTSAAKRNNGDCWRTMSSGAKVNFCDR
jgi:hypothetical protein